jgi:hypothetical protein
MSLHRALLISVLILPLFAAPNWLPGGRVLLDAHNCYIDQGKGADRLARAIKVHTQTGTPIAIEQDLLFDATRRRSAVTHQRPLTGNEPEFAYFFEEIRPIVEAALANPKRENWPLITLNLDLKSQETEHLVLINQVLKKYQAWLTTATKGDSTPKTLRLAPVLVLTGSSNAQEAIFHDNLNNGDPILAFGSLEKCPAAITNYRRWCNIYWKALEGAESAKGDISPEGKAKVEEWAKASHAQGAWLRIYTTNHSTPERAAEQGWGAGYQVPTKEALLARWKLYKSVGVDFIATDMYEDLASFLKQQ